jgi:hypothetical protein
LRRDRPKSHQFRYAIVLSLLVLIALPAAAQDDYIAHVRVESAFSRALPDFEAEATASIYEGEPLEAVSRNLDGSWLEVRRPGRLNKLGWVYTGTIEWDFAVEFLPLGDITTGVTGPNPLLSAPEFAVYFPEAPILRQQPLRRAGRVQPVVNIPPLVTLPVLARNQDGSWLFINYLGHQGWVVAFAGRDRPDVLDIPQAPNLPPLEGVPTVIIPVELQQAQIDRLRSFINERRAYAVNLESFWWRVYRGEIMPCDVPPEFTEYPYTADDVRQLPELNRYVPRLGEAIEHMATAREPFVACGIVSPRMVSRARDSAINARIIFDATLQTLQRLEEDVVQARR